MLILEKFDITRTYHEIKKFDCSHDIINRFATHSLKQNVKKEMCQAYVLLDTTKNDKFVGYYNIMAFSITKADFDTPPSGATKQIPVLRLIMLGVDSTYAKQGLGSKLLQHALKLTLTLASQTGIAGLYLDAEDGKHDYYAKRGFTAIKAPNPETNILPMFISLATIREAMITCTV